MSSAVLLNWFGPDKDILFPINSVNLVLHSKAVRKVLVSFNLAICSEISSHTTLLIWLVKGLWQLAQMLSLRNEGSLLPLRLLQELAPSVSVVLSLIFTLCLSSFHAFLLISPLSFILVNSSSSLPLLLLKLESSVLLSEERRAVGLFNMREENCPEVRSGESANRGPAVAGLSVIDIGLFIIDIGLLTDKAGLLVVPGLLDRELLSLPLDGDDERAELVGVVVVVVVLVLVVEVVEDALLRTWKKLQLAISITFFTSDSSSLPSHITSLDCLAFRY